MPVEKEVRSELLGLLGIVLTGIIDFSSTSFVANMMAGLMLRSVRSFRPGDFIEAGVEIVSPAFMNQRVLEKGRSLISHRVFEEEISAAQIFPESIIFDKANHAKKLESQLRILEILLERAQKQ